MRPAQTTLAAWGVFFFPLSSAARSSARVEHSDCEMATGAGKSADGIMRVCAEAGTRFFPLRGGPLPSSYLDAGAPVLNYTKLFEF